MTLDECRVGASYACKYRDLTGKQCVALIKTRDREQQLVEIIDVETNITMVVGYADITDIDTVEWQDEQG